MGSLRQTSRTGSKSATAAVATYAPICLLECAVRQPDASNAFHEERNGAVLYADISGFTTLSEQLAASGREGAEELTTLINEYFATMLEIAATYGGDILQFGGDSFLAYFPVSDGSTTASKDEALRAVQCGLEMQRAMAAFDEVTSSVGAFQLAMSIGVHVGRFQVASAAPRRGRRQQLFAGATLRRLVEVEGLAESGELLLTNEVASLVEDRVSFGTPRHDCLPALSVAEECAAYTPQSQDPLASLTADAGQQLLQPYVIPAIYHRIVDDPTGFANEGEHRFIATMFVHFEGINDAEDGGAAWLSQLDTYLGEMTEVIVDHGGEIARVSTENQGDKLLVLFGAPVAIENPERRALECALAMMSRLDRLNEQETSHVLQSIGITCGAAFCGNVGSQQRHEYTVIADQVNTAARLMGKAGAGEILVSRALRRSQDAVFEFADGGMVVLKGKRAPEPAFRLLSTSDQDARLQTTLVGREEQCAELRQVVTSVSAGSGCLTAITGEAGVGKSTLLHEFASMCGEAGFHSVWGQCHAQSANVPYQPWATVVRDIAELHNSDNVSACVEKLEARLSETPGQLSEWTPLLGTVIGMPIPDNEPTATLSPRQRKEKTFALIVALLRRWASSRPALIVLEDIQWIDPLSRELLVHVVEQLADSPVVFAVTYRPHDYPPVWADDTAITHLRLSPLSRQAATRMLENLLNSQPMSAEVSHLVIDKTQGNPFYVEQLVRTLLDSGKLVWNEMANQYELTDDRHSIDLPGTIQGLILSRLDTLPEQQRRILQFASVFGRAFSTEALRKVLPFELAPTAMDSRIREVSTLDLVDPAQPTPSPSYAFRHALVQEVAYESLSYARRREIHRAIGSELERSHPHAGEEHCEVLARHFDLGEDSTRAMKYLVASGDKAKRAYANQEAVDYYQRALKHAARRDDPGDVTASLLEDLGDVYTLTGNYTEGSDCYRRSLQDAQTPVKRARLEGKIGGVCYRQGQPRDGIEHLEQGLRHLGIRTPDGKWRVRASLARQFAAQVAHTWFPRAFVRARAGNDEETTRAAIDIYESYSRIAFEFDLERTLDAHLRQLNLCETMPDSPEMAQTYSSHGIVCGILPDFKRALQYQQRGLSIREERRDRWGIAQSLNFMGIVHYWKGDWQESRKCLKRSARIFHDVGDRWETEVTFLLLSFNSLRQGRLAEASEHAQTCLDLSRRAKDMQGMGWALGALADACCRQGDIDDARDYARQALQCSTEARDHMYVAVVRRIQADIELRLGEVEPAIEHMQASLQQINDYKLRQEYVLGTFAGLATVRLARLDAIDATKVDRQREIREIRKLCRQAVRWGTRFPNWLPEAWRARGMCEVAAGNRRSAEQCFARSLAAARARNARYEIARTLYESGRGLLDDDPVGAARQLSDARQLFYDCGATFDAQLVDQFSVGEDTSRPTTPHSRKTVPQRRVRTNSANDHSSRLK